jgi:DNA-directed RNA polymerase specialized sigma24 family protein
MECRENGAPIDMETHEASPFDLFASREVEHTVRQALSQLAEVYRTAVILRDLEGLSYEEVADVLDVSVGTVKSRILRGRRALREILEPVFKVRRAPEAACSLPVSQADDQMEVTHAMR